MNNLRNLQSIKWDGIFRELSLTEAQELGKSWRMLYVKLKSFTFTLDAVVVTEGASVESDMADVWAL